MNQHSDKWEKITKSHNLVKEYQLAAKTLSDTENKLSEIILACKNAGFSVSQLSLELQVGREFIEKLIGKSVNPEKNLYRSDKSETLDLANTKKQIVELRRDNAILKDALLLLARELERPIEI